MIQPRIIKEANAQLWTKVDGERQYMGTIESYLSLLDVRLQIKQAKAEGYWLEWRGPSGTWCVTEITSTGKLVQGTPLIYGKVDEYLTQLV